MSTTENPALLTTLTSENSYEEKNGAHWYTGETPNVRELARAMNAVGARFITITAYELPKGEGFRLEYHWDLEGRLLCFVFSITEKSIDSIYDLSEAVDWIERETYEEYGIEFTGRELEPLLLRQGDEPGVNIQQTTAPNKPAPAAAKPEEVAK